MSPEKKSKQEKPVQSSFLITDPDGNTHLNPTGKPPELPESKAPVEKTERPVVDPADAWKRHINKDD